MIRQLYHFATDFDRALLQNLDQADVFLAVVGTARRADPGPGAHPRRSESPVDFGLPPTTAGPSQPAPTDF